MISRIKKMLLLTAISVAVIALLPLAANAAGNLQLRFGETSYSANSGESVNVDVFMYQLNVATQPMIGPLGIMTINFDATYFEAEIYDTGLFPPITVPMPGNIFTVDNTNGIVQFQQGMMGFTTLPGAGTPVFTIRFTARNTATTRATELAFNDDMNFTFFGSAWLGNTDFRNATLTNVMPGGQPQNPGTPLWVMEVRNAGGAVYQNINAGLSANSTITVVNNRDRAVKATNMMLAIGANGALLGARPLPATEIAANGQVNINIGEAFNFAGIQRVRILPFVNANLIFPGGLPFELTRD